MRQNIPEPTGDQQASKRSGSVMALSLQQDSEKYTYFAHAIAVVSYFLPFIDY